MSDAIASIHDYVTQMQLNDDNIQRCETDIVELQPVAVRGRSITPQLPLTSLTGSFDNLSSRHQNNLSRNSVVSHLTIVEIDTSGTSEISEVVGQQVQQLPQKKDIKTAKKTKIKLTKSGSRAYRRKFAQIAQINLAVLTFLLFFVLPLHYTFIRDIFQLAQQYRLTYIPSLPCQLYLCVPIGLLHLAYFILYIYYARKFIKKQPQNKKVQISKVYRVVMSIAICQLILTLLWTDGITLSLQVRQRFQAASDYETKGPVKLLLDWLFLWSLNTISWLVNLVALLFYYVLGRHLK